MWMPIVALLVALVYSVKNFIAPNPKLPTDEELRWCTWIPLSPTKSKMPKEEILQKCNETYEKGTEHEIWTQGFRWRLVRGIPDEIAHMPDLPIIVYQGGYCQFQNSTSWCVHQCVIKADIPTRGIVISVDCPSDFVSNFRSFNFCDQADQHSWLRTLGRLKEIGATSDIVLFGGCKGALNLLHALSRQTTKEPLAMKDKIRAVILDAPPMDLYRALETVPAGRLAFYVIDRITPALNARLQLNVTTFPKDIPVFVSSIDTDGISKLVDVEALLKRMKEHGVLSITHYVYRNETPPFLKHGTLGKKQEYRQVLREWTQKRLYDS